MKESLRSVTEQKELLQPDKMSVIVIGDTCSGKSTLLNHFAGKGFSVQEEPVNKKMDLFIKDPKQYAFDNQLYKTMQLIQLEMQTAESKDMTNPYFQESGVIATDIYNRYLRDQDLITASQFEHLNSVFTHYLDTMLKPSFVVYLYADDATIRERTLKRDGVIAHDPHMLTPYWNRLLEDLERRNIPVLRIDTGKQTTDKTARIVLTETDRIKQGVASRPADPPRPDRPAEQVETSNEEPLTSFTLSWMEISVS